MALDNKFAINTSLDIPAWVQLRQRIIRLIESGELVAGEQLPTVRSLAAMISINFNTVSKTYTSLERDGYISTTRKGAFVNETKSDPDAIKAGESLADDYVRACLEEGLSYSEIRRQLDAAIARIECINTGEGDIF